MTCEYCEIIEGKKPAAKLYEDDKVVCVLSEMPATAGHILVIPKEHKPIFETLSDEMALHTFQMANKMSIALFQSIKAEGTNIITQNGLPAGQEVPHFCINVIARRAGDGLLFDWLPKKLTQDEMAQVEMQLKKELDKGEETAQIPEAKEPVEEAQKEKPEIEQVPARQPVKEEKPKEAEKQEEKPEKSEKEESYLIRQMRRMP